MLPRLLLALALACSTRSALAQDFSRLDPALRFAALVAPRFAADAQPGGVMLPLLRDPDGALLVRVLARLAPGGEDVLAQAGARLGARVGDVVAAQVPLAALATLARDPRVLYLEAAAWLRPDAAAPQPWGEVAHAHSVARSRFRLAAAHALWNDRSVVEIGGDALRQRIGDRFFGLAGQGVVIGIIDTGVDLGHPDLLDADGRTRVLYAWDQTASMGRPPGRVGDQQFDYGDECTRAAIDEQRCGLIDRVGHGTHVLATAAGDGSATGAGLPAFRYAGVAPEAELIVVKGGDGSFPADRVLDGVAYIFARAAELGRPAVVNLSLGAPNGPHDGSTLFERVLEQLAGAGRAIVTIAGNLGTNANESPAFVRAPLHAAATLAAGASAQHRLVVPPYAPNGGALNDAAVLELWYDGVDSLALTITSPRGEQVSAETGDTALVLGVSGGVFIDNASGGPQQTNGDHTALVVIFDADAAAPPDSGRWTLVVEGRGIHGSGRYHLWLTASNLRSATQLSFLEQGTTNTHLVSLPGTARRLITVAAYASKHDWRTAPGEARSFPFQEPLGDIAFFSSAGPRRDGELKPDLAAPGKVIMSARGRDAQQWQDLPWFIDEDGVHGALLGTSTAAPQVAGAVALLLQLRPAATPEELLGWLTAEARRDAFTDRGYTGEPPSSPNTQWGYGKLDIGAAVRALGLPAGTLALDVAALPAQPSASSRRGTRLPLLRLSFRADSLEAVSVERLGFELTGADTAARVLLVHDQDGDDTADAEETVALERTVALTGATQRVVFTGGPVIVPARTQTYLLAVELSGAAPNASRFAASYLPAETRTRGTLSGAENRLTGGAVTVASAEHPTTLLSASERVNLSANPVRGETLVINYSERPREIAIFSLTGKRVRRMAAAQLEEGRATWDLRNESGAAVANGIYLLVIHFPGSRVLSKIVVAR